MKPEKARPITTRPTLEIGDKLYTAKEAGYLEYIGDGKVSVYTKLKGDNHHTYSHVMPLNAAQTARWIELKARDGAVAHMDPRT